MAGGGVKGGTVIGRTSPNSLYSQNLASFDMTGYDAKDSAGFIRLFGLQLRVTSVHPGMGRGLLIADDTGRYVDANPAALATAHKASASSKA